MLASGAQTLTFNSCRVPRFTNCCKQAFTLIENGRPPVNECNGDVTPTDRRVIMRGVGQLPEERKSKIYAKSHKLKLDVPSGELRIFRFVEGNPVDDGVVFWICAVAYDLAVKILSDTPAGDVLYGHRIDETSFAES